MFLARKGRFCPTFAGAQQHLMLCGFCSALCDCTAAECQGKPVQWCWCSTRPLAQPTTVLAGKQKMYQGIDIGKFVPLDVLPAGESATVLYVHYRCVL